MFALSSFDCSLCLYSKTLRGNACQSPQCCATVKREQRGGTGEETDTLRTLLSCQTHAVPDVLQPGPKQHRHRAERAVFM